MTAVTGRRGPRVARSRSELAESVDAVRTGTVALVPTMGALHEGHLSLIRLAREHADVVVVSIFVNPLQFGPGEDFERYPRAFPADLEACRAEGVDVVFAPPLEVIYPDEPVVRVSSGTMGECWEGASRAGHFDGVLTVVLKLFHLVAPDVAVFGEKDAQQLAVIRRMVHDLNVPVRIMSGAIVRASDGLAVSSRNAYLSASERRSALSLPRALRAGVAAADAGAEAVRRASLEVLANEPGLLLDYMTLVEPDTFAEVSDKHAGSAVLAAAAYAGTTRLIDNVRVTLPSGAAEDMEE